MCGECRCLKNGCHALCDCGSIKWVAVKFAANTTPSVIKDEEMVYRCVKCDALRVILDLSIKKA